MQTVSLFLSVQADSCKDVSLHKIDNLNITLWSSYATLTTYYRTKTVIQCAARCSQHTATCGVMTFEPSRAACTLGQCAISQPVARSPSVDLYQTRPPLCNSTPGFNVERNGNTSACLWWSVKSKNFTDAMDDCRAKGAILAVFKTYEKFQIVQSRRHRTYIGLDDMLVEGTFRWHDDNSILDMDYAKTIFLPGDPNNFNNQDCVSTYERYWVLVDIGYSDIQLYVFEKICFT
ncbi:C-type lectin domain 4 member E [Bulinus truncatus]|nr:C-type lectin domain 4 member E [Bulinus truncatus]